MLQAERHLLPPLFSSFRIPSRYTIPFLLFAVMTTGWALTSPAVEAMLTNRYARGAVTKLRERPEITPGSAAEIQHLKRRRGFDVLQ